MKHWKKFVVLITAACMILAMTGCGSKESDPATAEEIWAAKLGDQELPGGLYNMYLINGYMNAGDIVGSDENLLNKKIEDKPVEEYIRDEADKSVRGILSVRKQFADRGLTLSEDETSAANFYAQYYYSYNNQAYVTNGISQDNIIYMLEANYMNEKLFLSIYGSGGEREYPVETLKKTFEDRYTRSIYILFEKTGKDGEALSDEQLADLRTQAESYYNRALAGEDMVDLDIEYYNSALAEGEEPYVRTEDDGHRQEMYVAKTDSGYPQEYVDKLDEMADDEIAMLETDDFIFVIKKLNIADAPAEYAQDYYNDILREFKGEEFADLTTEWAEQADVEYNDEALKLYTPAKLRVTSEQITAKLIDMGLYNSSQQS